MLLTTYKNTFKNLIRSTTFWLLVSLLVIVAAQGARESFYLGDDDPNFVLNYKDYVQCIINSVAAKLLMYALPIFAVITVVLVLNRDYGDKFFEIEKAANIKPFAYLSGRLSALISINFVVLLLSNLLCFHYYDTEWFEDMITRQKTSVTHVAFCISFLVGVAVLCSVVSYIRVRQRNN